MKKQQRGGTIVGFTLGVIVGLGAALAVAVYVTKVPVPFLNKSTPRASEQDEATKNKNWDPNAPLYGKNPVRPAAPAAAPATSADPFEYFVQAGAFRTQQDADAQRAKLAMLGWEARVSEREQNGRTVFRVRVGPFGKRDDAESLKERLDGAGVESALVRVQR